jgi:hypothetical protein
MRQKPVGKRFLSGTDEQSLIKRGFYETAYEESHSFVKRVF